MPGEARLARSSSYRGGIFYFSTHDRLSLSLLPDMFSSHNTFCFTNFPRTFPLSLACSLAFSETFRTTTKVKALMLFNQDDLKGKVRMDAKEGGEYSVCASEFRYHRGSFSPTLTHVTTFHIKLERVATFLILFFSFSAASGRRSSSRRERRTDNRTFEMLSSTASGGAV